MLDVVNEQVVSFLKAEDFYNLGNFVLFLYATAPNFTNSYHFFDMLVSKRCIAITDISCETTRVDIESKKQGCVVAVLKDPDTSTRGKFPKCPVICLHRSEFGLTVTNRASLVRLPNFVLKLNFYQRFSDTQHTSLRQKQHLHKCTYLLTIIQPSDVP